MIESGDPRTVDWPTWMGEVDAGLPRCLQPADDDVVFGQ